MEISAFLYGSASPAASVTAALPQGSSQMTPLVGIALPVFALYLLFLLWYGGRGKPLTQDEIDGFLRELGAHAHGPESQVTLDAVRELVAGDDGREFVMQNLVRYRPKAVYPPGYAFDDDPRAADRRYGKAIVGPLLRRASMMVFVARRSGRFVEPPGADAWHYVAMVRYRSRRDFLRFAVEVERGDIAVHKWAAIEKTHVFPVRPLVSLIFVRGAVAVLLALAGAALYSIVR
jgi:hypothetical protein